MKTFKIPKSLIFIFLCCSFLIFNFMPVSASDDLKRNVIIDSTTVTINDDLTFDLVTRPNGSLSASDSVALSEVGDVVTFDTTFHFNDNQSYFTSEFEQLFLSFGGAFVVTFPEATYTDYFISSNLASCKLVFSDGSTKLIDVSSSSGLHGFWDSYAKTRTLAPKFNFIINSSDLPEDVFIESIGFVLYYSVGTAVEDVTYSTKINYSFDPDDNYFILNSYGVQNETLNNIDSNVSDIDDKLNGSDETDEQTSLTQQVEDNINTALDDFVSGSGFESSKFTLDNYISLVGVPPSELTSTLLIVGDWINDFCMDVDPLLKWVILVGAIVGLLGFIFKVTSLKIGANNYTRRSSAKTTGKGGKPN